MGQSRQISGTVKVLFKLLRLYFFGCKNDNYCGMNMVGLPIHKYVNVLFEAHANFGYSVG